MGQIVLAPTGCLAEMSPTGGLVASSPEQVRIDESIEPVDGMGIQTLPVSTKNTRHPREQMGCQAMGIDPWKHEKSGIIGQKVNVFTPSSCIPADVAVSAPDMSWRRRPGKAGNRSSMSESQVFEVLANWSCVTEVVKLCEQSIMKVLERSASDLVNGYGSE